ncbi:CinA family protein [Natranaeroarchaeum sulfidigenes]|uniref:CinA3 n=1 Tax=Natranaeroarchaeum sulfidigenes TaxID=2784880 RepID=A0A897MNM7_9EURY|nr:CinA family protein [Natranaeroarchaeum sulfidigenes]QSG03780.1 CinA3 [Natranaeroarchaeum sulfidigenes]
MSDPDDSTKPPGATLAAELGDQLREQDATIATAESCTGGLMGAALTAVPGSSDYFDRALVTYAYDAKRQLLGVNREDLDDHGAVSEPVARQMASGVRDTADVTWGVGITGVAGPGGGTEETPVGTVYLGVAYAGPWETNESYTTVSRYEFEGDRSAVRSATVQQALEDVLAELRLVSGL